MNGGFNESWVFGYGSLIWGAGTVLIAERIEGFLDWWHREGNWISASRHGYARNFVSAVLITNL
jgi:cation transport regulator ChaC